jgi:hypothetical protein
MITEGTLEHRLVNLMREIKELKKDLILQKSDKPKTARGSPSKWQALGERVSSRWDHVSAVEEVSMQREKR